jgi:hypothetical protein
MDRFFPAYLLVEHGAMDAEAYARWRSVSKEHREAIDSDVLLRRIPETFWECSPCLGGTLKQHGILFEQSSVRPWAVVALLDALDTVSRRRKGARYVATLNKAFAGLLPPRPPETVASFVATSTILTSVWTWCMRLDNKRTNLTRWAAFALLEYLDRSFSSAAFCDSFLAKLNRDSKKRLLRIIRDQCTTMISDGRRLGDGNRDHLNRFLVLSQTVGQHASRLDSMIV